MRHALNTIRALPLGFLAMTAHVRPGVFFDVPAALPRGRHQLSRGQVRDAQRQRLMIAFTELLADRGYAGVRIHLASVYGVRDLACDALEGSKEPNFSELTPEVVDWIVAAWYGTEDEPPRAPD
jgi:hypothetical protein